MITLDASNKSLEAILSAIPTTEADYIAVWQDIRRGEPERFRTQQGTTNGTTAVTVGDAPSGDTLLSQLLWLTLYNADVGSVTATLRLDVGGTPYVVWQGALATTKTLLVSKNSGIVLVS